VNVSQIVPNVTNQQKMIDFQLLLQCPVFKSIHEKELKVLLNKIHFQTKKYSKDEVVVFAGEWVSHLYIIMKGSVKGEMIDYSGKILKIEDIEAPKALATAFLFGKENKYPVTVTANNDVEILAIPVEEFIKLLQLNAQILKNYLHIITSQAQFLSRKLHFLSFKTIREKVAHYLLQQAGENLLSVEFKNTQQQLADLFGVSRPSLARVFGEMQKDGLIKMEKKTVTLIDKMKLNALLKNG